MVRKVIVKPRPVLKAKDAEKTVVKTKRHTRLPYIRKHTGLSKVSGQTRMSKFLRQSINQLNNQDYYKNTTPSHERLFLPVAKGVKKVSSAAVKTYRNIAERLVASYISRASLIAHSLNHVRGITSANLRIVDSFFVAV
jgi:hypothetical protein